MGGERKGGQGTSSRRAQWQCTSLGVCAHEVFDSRRPTWSARGAGRRRPRSDRSFWGALGNRPGKEITSGRVGSWHFFFVRSTCPVNLPPFHVDRAASRKSSRDHGATARGRSASAGGGQRGRMDGQLAAHRSHRHLAASSATPAPTAQGMLGLEFASDRPTETKSLHCPSGFITGIRVRYGRRAYAPLASSMPCPAPMQAPDGRRPHRSACAPLCAGHAQRTATCTTSSSSAATAGRAGRASGSRARWRTRSGSAPRRCT